ncbi:unnamed protein product [Amoebophrya sp. A25]|nr:unnamed protein product [Amoebophrya sp. A25]|eukprot:GSA25T00010735001.1
MNPNSLHLLQELQQQSGGNKLDKDKIPGAAGAAGGPTTGGISSLFTEDPQHRMYTSYSFTTLGATKNVYSLGLPTGLPDPTVFAKSLSMNMLNNNYLRTQTHYVYDSTGFGSYDWADLQYLPPSHQEVKGGAGGRQHQQLHHRRQHQQQDESVRAVTTIVLPPDLLELALYVFDSLQEFSTACAEREKQKKLMREQKELLDKVGQPGPPIVKQDADGNEVEVATICIIGSDGKAQVVPEEEAKAEMAVIEAERMQQEKRDAKRSMGSKLLGGGAAVDRGAAAGDSLQPEKPVFLTRSNVTDNWTSPSISDSIRVGEISAKGYDDIIREGRAASSDRRSKDSVMFKTTASSVQKLRAVSQKVGVLSNLKKKDGVVGEAKKPTSKWDQINRKHKQEAEKVKEAAKTFASYVVVDDDDEEGQEESEDGAGSPKDTVAGTGAAAAKKRRARGGLSTKQDGNEDGGDYGHDSDSNVSSGAGDGSSGGDKKGRKSSRRGGGTTTKSKKGKNNNNSLGTIDEEGSEDSDDGEIGSPKRGKSSKSPRGIMKKSAGGGASKSSGNHASFRDSHPPLGPEGFPEYQYEDLLREIEVEEEQEQRSYQQLGSLPSYVGDVTLLRYLDFEQLRGIKLTMYGLEILPEKTPEDRALTYLSEHSVMSPRTSSLEKLGPPYPINFEKERKDPNRQTFPRGPTFPDWYPNSQDDLLSFGRFPGIDVLESKGDRERAAKIQQMQEELFYTAESEEQKAKLQRDTTALESAQEAAFLREKLLFKYPDKEKKFRNKHLTYTPHPLVEERADKQRDNESKTLAGVAYPSGAVLQATMRVQLWDPQKLRAHLHKNPNRKADDWTGLKAFKKSLAAGTVPLVSLEQAKLLTEKKDEALKLLEDPEDTTGSLRDKIFDKVMFKSRLTQETHEECGPYFAYWNLCARFTFPLSTNCSRALPTVDAKFDLSSLADRQIITRDTRPVRPRSLRSYIPFVPDPRPENKDTFLYAGGGTGGKASTVSFAVEGTAAGSPPSPRPAIAGEASSLTTGPGVPGVKGRASDKARAILPSLFAEKTKSKFRSKPLQLGFNTPDAGAEGEQDEQNSAGENSGAVVAGGLPSSVRAAQSPALMAKMVSRMKGMVSSKADEIPPPKPLSSTGGLPFSLYKIGKFKKSRWSYYMLGGEMFDEQTDLERALGKVANPRTGRSIARGPGYYVLNPQRIIRRKDQKNFAPLWQSFEGRATFLGSMMYRVEVNVTTLVPCTAVVKLLGSKNSKQKQWDLVWAPPLQFADQKALSDTVGEGEEDQSPLEGEGATTGAANLEQEGEGAVKVEDKPTEGAQDSEKKAEVGSTSSSSSASGDDNADVCSDENAAKTKDASAPEKPKRKLGGLLKKTKLPESEGAERDESGGEKPLGDEVDLESTTTATSHQAQLFENKTAADKSKMAAALATFQSSLPKLEVVRAQVLPQLGKAPSNSMRVTWLSKHRFFFDTRMTKVRDLQKGIETAAMEKLQLERPYTSAPLGANRLLGAVAKMKNIRDQLKLGDDDATGGANKEAAAPELFQPPPMVVEMAANNKANAKGKKVGGKNWILRLENLEHPDWPVPEPSENLAGESFTFRGRGKTFIYEGDKLEYLDGPVDKDGVLQPCWRDSWSAMTVAELRHKIWTRKAFSGLKLAEVQKMEREATMAQQYFPRNMITDLDRNPRAEHFGFDVSGGFRFFLFGRVRPSPEASWRSYEIQIRKLQVAPMNKSVSGLPGANKGNLMNNKSSSKGMMLSLRSQGGVRGKSGDKKSFLPPGEIEVTELLPPFEIPGSGAPQSKEDEIAKLIEEHHSGPRIEAPSGIPLEPEWWGPAPDGEEKRKIQLEEVKCVRYQEKHGSTSSTSGGRGSKAVARASTLKRQDSLSPMQKLELQNQIPAATTTRTGASATNRLAVRERLSASCCFVNVVRIFEDSANRKWRPAPSGLGQFGLGSAVFRPRSQVWYRGPSWMVLGITLYEETDIQRKGFLAKHQFEFLLSEFQDTSAVPPPIASPNTRGGRGSSRRALADLEGGEGTMGQLSFELDAEDEPDVMIGVTMREFVGGQHFKGGKKLGDEARPGTQEGNFSDLTFAGGSNRRGEMDRGEFMDFLRALVETWGERRMYERLRTLLLRRLTERIKRKLVWEMLYTRN